MTTTREAIYHKTRDSKGRPAGYYIVRVSSGGKLRQYSHGPFATKGAAFDMLVRV